ncbi:Sterile alpha motif domain [Dillenia turbinata]|uniref:Sterile alpha motif domain n=1 Tax=Dillenia turbinata TaxID=194707 RepID=A0AAN8W121_9MAGN
MNWFSWLSKSGLDPSLIYEYGLLLARNELREEDIVYFDHEFLQSMGISVAKHRLEILKLAKKVSIPGSLNPIFKFLLALRKTKKCLTKCVSGSVCHEDAALMVVPEPVPNSGPLQGPLLRKQKSSLEVEQGKWMPTNRSPRVSGPLDPKTYEKMMLTSRSPRALGPLDRRVVSGPLDGRSLSPRLHNYNHNKEKVEGCDGVRARGFDESRWATMFHDMKPT